jgi:hypothetical protein
MNIYKAAIFFITLNIYCQKSAVEVSYVVNQDNSVDFKYIKSAPGSYTIAFKFDRLDNSSPERTSFVLKDYSGSLFTLRPLNKENGISFSYKTTLTQGILSPKTDLNFVYLLPFAKGEKVEVFEHTYAYNAYFGTEVPKDWKAYQFVPESADTVYAARKGVVISIEDKLEIDTVSSFTSQRNMVKVEHNDGTYAEYKGFKQNGLLVAIGQTIYPQMPIGLLSDQSKKLSFMVYFRIKVDVKPDEKLQTYKSRVECIAPLFYTSDGITKLTGNSSYTVDYDEKTVFQELSKKEIKNWNKK